MKFRVILIILLICAGSFLAYQLLNKQSANPSLNKLNLQVGSIQTNNYANKELKYYYYVPSSIEKYSGETHPLIVLFSGTGADSRGLYINAVKEFAEESKMIVLIVNFVFDEDNFQQGKSYTYPKWWSGQAFLDILTQMATDGYKIGDLYLFGYSAGAQFVLRFANIKPGLIKACYACAFGQEILPEFKSDIKFMVVVGTEDASYRINNNNTFFKAAKKGNLAVYHKKYPGMNHNITKHVVVDAVEFFRAVYNNKLDEFNIEGLQK